MTPRLASLLVVATLAVTACTGDDSASPADVAPNPPAATDAARPTAPDKSVTISRSRFDQRELVVAVGTTVVFENRDAFAHTVTSTDASPLAFDSGDLGEGGTFEVTFDQPGTYPYFCEIHPTMRATVIVE